MFEGVFQNKTNIAFGHLHVLSEVRERDFRLNHPEFRQMTSRVRVLSAL